MQMIQMQRTKREIEEFRQMQEAWKLMEKQALDEEDR